MKRFVQYYQSYRALKKRYIERYVNKVLNWECFISRVPDRRRSAKIVQVFQRKDNVIGCISLEITT